MPSCDSPSVFLENGREAMLPGFDPFFGHWIAWLRTEAKDESTITAYANGLASCCVVIAEINGCEADADSLSKISPDALVQMRRYMDECSGYKPGTIGMRMAALRSFASYLHRNVGLRCDAILMERNRHAGKGTRHVPGVGSPQRPLSGASGRRSRIVDADIIKEYGSTLPTSRSPYLSAVRGFARFLEPRKKTLREASTTDLADFKKLRSQKCRPRTVALDHSALVSFYGFLFSNGRIRTNPVIDIHAPRSTKEPRLGASLETVGRWLDGIDRLLASYLIAPYVALRVEVLIRLLALEGLKLGQALEITRDAVLEHAIAIAGRHAGFSARTYAVLEQLAKASGCATYVFRGQDPTRPASRQQPRLWLKRVGDQLGLDPISPERLTQAYRHEFPEASKNANLLIAQVGLGPARPSTTIPSKSRGARFSGAGRQPDRI